MTLYFRSNSKKMEEGLRLAKLQQQAIVTQVQSFLDMNQIVSAGPFLYGFVQEVCIFNKDKSLLFK